MTDADNIVAFPARIPAPDFEDCRPYSVEIYMVPETCNLEIELFDADGACVATIAHDVRFVIPREGSGLSVETALDALRSVWARVRGSSAPAA